MVEKIKLYEIGNKGNFSYYSFDRKQKVIEKLIEIFSRTLAIYFPLHMVHRNKKGKKINTKVNYTKFKDIHGHSEGRGDKVSRVDIFYGDKRIFVILHCSEKSRLEFNEALAKISYIPKSKIPKNAKKIKDKDKGKILGDFEFN